MASKRARQRARERKAPAREHAHTRARERPATYSTRAYLGLLETRRGRDIPEQETFPQLLLPALVRRHRPQATAPCLRLPCHCRLQRIWRRVTHSIGARRRRMTAVESFQPGGAATCVRKKYPRTACTGGAGLSTPSTRAASSGRVGPELTRSPAIGG